MREHNIVHIFHHVYSKIFLSRMMKKYKITKYKYNA
jgi:hypothetical protein